MPKLSAPQNIFLNGLNTKFKALVGGYGSGKTFTLCLDLLLWAGRHPGYAQGFYGPTYAAIRDIFYPTFEEAAEYLGFTIEVHVSNKEVDIYRNGFWYGKIICRSMDKPSTIIGYKVARAMVDEIDVLDAKKARDAWNKIVARLRVKIDGVLNDVGVGTTPEGFKFVHSRFANNPKESYSMVQASTYENEEHLPPDYISSLIETYPNQLIDAYLRGLFVNLTSGTVFNAYNRIKHASLQVVKTKEPLRIGMDFNVTNMSAVVYVIRGGAWHAVDELTHIYDTPAMIVTIQEKFPEHKIIVYPDASGSSRKTIDASISDIALLEQAGFAVYANPTNPFIKDRVQATNAAFDHGKLYINTVMCPEYANCMEQLAYDKNGMPDKKSDLDHLPDAGTYPIAFEMPVVKPAVDLSIRFAN